MEKGKINIFKNIKSVKDIIRVIAYFFLFLLVSLCVYTFFTVDIMKKDYANVFGYTYFVVSTGSMSGTIEVNDIIFVKIDDDVKINDVITYKNENGDIITHRLSLEQGSHAYEIFDAKKDDCIKVVLKP